MLVSDELGLAVVWPGPVEGPGRTLLSAARVGGAWRPAVTAVAGDFVTAYSPADGAGGVLVARVSVGDTLANDVALVHSAADAWTVAGARPSGSFGDVWGPGVGSRVAALEWIDTGSIYNNGVLRYLETRATEPSPPDEDLNVAGPYKRGWTVTWKALASGEVVAVYGTTDWNDGSMVTYFQRRSAEGSWSAPWSVPQATVAAIAGDDGGGWTLASTQAPFTDFQHTTPWQLRLRRFSVTGTGTYGPDVLVAEGQVGGQPQARRYLPGDRVLASSRHVPAHRGPLDVRRRRPRPLVRGDRVASHARRGRRLAIDAHAVGFPRWASEIGFGAFGRGARRSSSPSWPSSRRVAEKTCGDASSPPSRAAV